MSWNPHVALALWAGCLSWTAHAQLRVVNGGFESHLALPNATGQLHFCADWSGSLGTSQTLDYYHNEGTGAGDLPQTPLAKVAPHGGNAVAGLVAFSDEMSPRHEYLSGKFSQPLQPGQRYSMSFALTSGRVHDWVDAGMGISGLGVALGFGAPVQEGHEKLDLHAQFEIHEALVDPDWRYYTFVFQADEAFTHFTFGLLGKTPRIRKDDVEGRTLAYYFVDDFFIEPTEMQISSSHRPIRGSSMPEPEEALFVPNAFTPDLNQVNDLWMPSLPQDCRAWTTVTTRWGNVVWQREFDGEEAPGQGWDGLDMEGELCPGGLYAWSIRMEGPHGVSEHKGLLQLIR